MSTNLTKTVVLYSGGLDSTVVLALEMQRPGNEVHTLTFDYGQSCAPELQCCSRLAALWGFRHRIVSLGLASSDARDEIKARNTIMLARALQHALEVGAGRVVYGAEPDSRYADSSQEYIDAMEGVFAAHGVEFAAPVKSLGDKVGVLRAALDLGVPLHLVHPARGVHVNGSCSSSRKFLRALASLFPCINPMDLLRTLEDFHNECGNDQPFNLRTVSTGSFKAFPALTYLAAKGAELTGLPSVPVFTTGNWGISLLAVSSMLRLPITWKVTKTIDLETLRENMVSTSSVYAQWGIKQALSRLPRPSVLNTHVTCTVTQGHLKQALESLGYHAGPALKDEPCLLLLS